ncbi:MAG: LacI family DNA-binding transcriptional regulator [Oscillospiraceae bacterium]|nr:LacI family DNA-binding transcriptional regulator [Oscillospiraceae bacterium]
MTIYDIAKEAGVSASTVSRVINGKTGVKKETREKIQHLLQQYNFIPDENARGLVSKSSKLIGILLEDIRNHYHTVVAYAIEQQLSKSGYCGIILNTSEYEKHIESSMEILEQRRVEGVIMVGSMFQSEFVDTCIDRHLSGIPIVMANGKLERENVWSVLVNEADGMAQCIDLLRAKDKKNIIYIQKPTTQSSARKKQGFVKKMKALGYPESEIIVVDAKPTLEGGYRATAAAIKQHIHTQAFIYSEDIMAVGGLHALSDLNIKVPENVAIMGIDNSVYSKATIPQLSTVDHGMEELGFLAAHTLITVLAEEPVPRCQQLEAKVVERKST